MTNATGSTHSGPAADGVEACRIGASGVSRSFGPVRANADVSFAVRKGSVHALIGENGAGKSTLMRILYGLDFPDAGSVLIDGKAVVLAGPRDTIKRGIGLVQQELAIIDELTLLENLVLGEEPRRGVSIDWKRARADAKKLAESVGSRIDWSTPAGQAPIAIQQQVEILRLIYRGADVLILDEPTAVLAPAQASQLLRLLSTLRDAGRTIVFISHKLDEVIEIADDITVLRAGRTVASLRGGETSVQDLAELIMGDGAVIPARPTTRPPGQEILTVDRVSAVDDRGTQRLARISLTLHEGEIVGVAAVAGNGQEELAEVLIGLRKTNGGSTRLDGADITGHSVRRRRRAGIAYVSADRKHEGLALALPLTDNAIATPRLGSLGAHGWLSRRAVQERARAIFERASVRLGSPSDPASSLSGGNQQRVVIGREMIDNPRVVIASQPTRGVDIRGIGFIHELLRQARDEGAGILLFSEELDELRNLSDRIIVLQRGQIAGELPGGSSRSAIGDLMLSQTAALQTITGGAPFSDNDSSKGPRS